MINKYTAIKGFALSATDGEIGKIKDMLFDATGLQLRYLVVNTGNWLIGRKILLSPEVLSPPEMNKEVIPVRLTKEAVESSPHLEEHKPVSRRFETSLAEYYQWPSYWDSMGIAEGNLTPTLPPPDLEMQVESETFNPVASEDAQLRSVEEMLHYKIHARDDEFGRITDVLFEDQTWVLRYWIVDTAHWLPGRKVLVDSQCIQSVNFPDQRLDTILSRDDIRHSPVYDPHKPVSPNFDRAVQEYFHQLMTSDPAAGNQPKK